MKRIDRLFIAKEELWILAGPLAVLLSLTLFSIKAPIDHISLPIAALFGIVLCGIWKTRGLVFGLFAISTTLIYHYSGMPNSERVWAIGMGTSLSLALIVLALTLEEFQNRLQIPSEPSIDPQLLQELDQERKIRADLESSLQNHIVRQQEHEVLQSYFENLQSEKNALVSELQERVEQISSLSRQLEASHEVLNALQKDFADGQDKLALREKSNEDSLSTLSQVQHEQVQLKKTAHDLSVRLEATLSEKEQLQSILFNLRKEQESLLQKNKETLQSLAEQANESNQSQNTIRELSATKEQLQQQYEKVIAESETFKAEIDKEKEALQVQIKALIEERDLGLTQQAELDRALRVCQGKLQQLREQFNEKTTVLAETRHQLFHTEESVALMQREWEEYATYTFHPEDRLMIKQLELMKKDSESNEIQLTKEIEALHELVAFLSNNTNSLSGR